MRATVKSPICILRLSPFMVVKDRGRSMSKNPRSRNFDIKMWDGFHNAIRPDVGVIRVILNHVLNILWVPIRAPRGLSMHWIRTTGSLKVVNSQILCSYCPKGAEVPGREPRMPTMP